MANIYQIHFDTQKIDKISSESHRLCRK